MAGGLTGEEESNGAEAAPHILITGDRNCVGTVRCAAAHEI